MLKRETIVDAKESHHESRVRRVLINAHLASETLFHPHWQMSQRDSGLADLYHLYVKSRTLVGRETLIFLVQSWPRL